MSERATKPNRRARRAAKAQTKTWAVPPETLEELKDLKEEADLAQAEAQAASSEFQLAVAREFRKLKAPIQDSAICLNCGTVRPRTIQACPECPPAGQAPMPPPAPPKE